MSVANAIQKGDFDLNLVSLRKPLEFPDGSIQDTAYTGSSGIPTLEEVLVAGNDANGIDIVGLGGLDLEVGSQIFQATTTSSPYPAFNQLEATNILTERPAGNLTFGVLNTQGGIQQGVLTLPQASNNIYNPIINANDVALVSNSTNAGVGFCLTSDSATTNGLRLTDTALTIGAGGTADTPSVNTTYNATAGQVITTTTAGEVIQSSNIEPTPTLFVKDVPTGQGLYFIPKANAGNYNPMSAANNQQIIAGGSASNTQTLEISPWSSTSCGVRMSGAGTAYCEIGAGGGGADPSNRINFTANGTLEYGQSHQFVNGVAQYDTAGSAGRIIPCSTSTGATIVPSLEFHTVQLGGNASSATGNITLTNNTTNTTNYAVMPSIYYGYTGSGGTYNATATSGAVSQIIITAITNTQFTWTLEKTTGDNVNIYLCFLVVYQIANSNYPKVYS